MNYLSCQNKKNNDSEDVDNNEDSDSSKEGKNDNIFAFERSIPDDAPATNWGISETEKRSLDAAAARSECERVSADWIEHKVPQSKLYSKK